MRTIRQAPAYAMPIAGQWRVVVPIRGRLTPRVCAEVFGSRHEAEAWLNSDDGLAGVAEARERRWDRSVAARDGVAI